MLVPATFWEHLLFVYQGMFHHSTAPRSLCRTIFNMLPKFNNCGRYKVLIFGRYMAQEFLLKSFCSRFLFFNFLRSHRTFTWSAARRACRTHEAKWSQQRNRGPNTSKSLTPLSRRFCTNLAATRLATHLCKMMNKNWCLHAPIQE